MKQVLKVGILIVFTHSSTVFAWGAKGHQIVAYTAAQLATSGLPFWQANAEGMRQLSTVPDRVWKSLPTAGVEKPNHWFQADAYTSDMSGAELLSFPKSYAEAVNKYTESVIITNGTAPWRIRQFYYLALEALKANNALLALQYAGVMTHYVGDLSQPLHVTVNYDGQMSGNSGIHAFFETTNIVDEMSIRADVLLRAQTLLKDPGFSSQFQGDLSETIYNETTRSLNYRDQILQIDKNLGRGFEGRKAQLDLAKNRMADGAATLSLILGQLWTESGIVLISSPSSVKDPAWVPPQFADFKAWTHPMCVVNGDPEKDSCQ